MQHFVYLHDFMLAVTQQMYTLCSSVGISVMNTLDFSLTTKTLQETLKAKVTLWYQQLKLACRSTSKQAQSFVQRLCAKVRHSYSS